MSTTSAQTCLDPYGFEITTNPIQQQTLLRCKQKEDRQRLKWQEYSIEEQLPPHDKLKKLCRKGIPPELRKHVWTQVSGAKERRHSHDTDYYRTAVDHGRSTSPFLHQIQLDVPRTFPNCPWIQSDVGQASLRRILLAFASHNHGVGYCQGMNYVAATLLIAMEYDEEAAFWVLASLIDTDDRGILYHDVYARDLSGCHVEMRSLRELVSLKMPRLSSHMMVLNCDMSIIATDWYLCLYCTSLPMETCLRVWDALFHEGPKILFRVALALLKMHEPSLLSTDNAGDLLRRTRIAAAEEYDRDELMKVAFDGVGSLPMERIQKYRMINQKTVDEELVAREMRVKLRAAVKEGYVLMPGEEGLLEEPGLGSEQTASQGSEKRMLSEAWMHLQAAGAVFGEKTKATLEASRGAVVHAKSALMKTASNAASEVSTATKAG